jgi:riboflavin-specific deaminase-like protein
MFTFSNLATSVDGKIATSSREFFPIGTPEDRRMMQVLRRKSDVVVFGASSLRTFRKPCIVYGPAAQGLKKQPANAVLSSKLEGISPAWPFFTRPGFHRILFVSAQAPKKTLVRFEKSCEIITLQKPSAKLSTAKNVLRELETRGYRKALVEGGGNVMWDFVRDNLIDEYYVTLTPRLIGGTEAPTLVDGQGFSPAQVLNLKLARCKKIGDELYLVYKKTGRRGP